MLHGTFDFSTPYENALELWPFLRRGYFAHVERGTHNVYHELQLIEGQSMRELISSYLEANEQDLPIGETQLAIPSVNYKSPEAPALYELLVEGDL